MQHTVLLFAVNCLCYHGVCPAKYKLLSHSAVTQVPVSLGLVRLGQTRTELPTVPSAVYNLLLLIYEVLVLNDELTSRFINVFRVDEFGGNKTIAHNVENIVCAFSMSQSNCKNGYMLWVQITIRA